MRHPPRPIRLVALDLDGTTLNSSHEVSPATITAVQQASAQGVRIVLASGRLPRSILPFARALGLRGRRHLGAPDGRGRHAVLTQGDPPALVYDPAAWRQSWTR